MDALRPRPWLAEPAEPPMRLTFEPHHVKYLQTVAAIVLVAVGLLVASLVVRELRFAPWSFDIKVDAASPLVPREAVSVPMLVLGGGRQVRVGEARLDAIAELGSMSLLRRAEDRGSFGAREVRSYQGLTLVFEPFERAGGSRVAAIYLQ
jgi:hypothetical protein